MEKLFKKKLGITGLFLALLLMSGCTPVVKKEVREENAPSKLRFYGQVKEYTSTGEMLDALQKEFADEYEIEAEPVDWENIENEIQMQIISGDPCDVLIVPMNRLEKLEGLAMDLTPYVEEDPDWKSSFNKAALKEGTVHGKIKAIPWEYNFPVILANRRLLEKAGVLIPQEWDYAAFEMACEKVKSTGVYPFANATNMGHGGWLYRNGLLSLCQNTASYSQYIDGSLSPESDEIRKTLQTIRSLYEKDYMYTGSRAVNIRVNEIKAAYLKGEIAMITDIGTGARAARSEAEEAGIDTVLLPWPRMGSENVIHSGSNGLFIPKNCKNPEAAIRLLKAYTGEEVQSIHLKHGYIPANQRVAAEDPFMESVRGQINYVRTEGRISSDLLEYISYEMTPELVMDQGVGKAIQKISELQ